MVSVATALPGPAQPAGKLLLTLNLCVCVCLCAAWMAKGHLMIYCIRIIHNSFIMVYLINSTFVVDVGITIPVKRLGRKLAGSSGKVLHTACLPA